VAGLWSTSISTNWKKCSGGGAIQEIPTVTLGGSVTVDCHEAVRPLRLIITMEVSSEH
jgi:hypothetical protein